MSIGVRTADVPCEQVRARSTVSAGGDADRGAAAPRSPRTSSDTTSATTPTIPVSFTSAPSPPTTPAAVGVPPLREHDRAEQRDAHEDVVASTVDEVQRGERAEREEGDRVGRTRPSPHDDARGRQRRGGKALVEEASPEQRAASTTDATPDSAVNAGPYTDGVWSPGVPDHARATGRAGTATATCVYGLAWYTARMRP